MFQGQGAARLPARGRTLPGRQTVGQSFAAVIHDGPEALVCNLQNRSSTPTLPIK